MKKRDGLRAAMTLFCFCFALHKHAAAQTPQQNPALTPSPSVGQNAPQNGAAPGFPRPNPGAQSQASNNLPPPAAPVTPVPTRPTYPPSSGPGGANIGSSGAATVLVPALPPAEAHAGSHAKKRKSAKAHKTKRKGTARRQAH